MLNDVVAQGRHGVKNGGGLTGDFDPELTERVVAYRSEAYSRMAQPIAELGPSPMERGA